RPGQLTDDPGTGQVSLGPDVERDSVTRDDVAPVVIALLDEPDTAGKVLNPVNGETPVVHAVRATLSARREGPRRSSGRHDRFRPSVAGWSLRRHHGSPAEFPTWWTRLTGSTAGRALNALIRADGYGIHERHASRAGQHGRRARQGRRAAKAPDVHHPARGQRLRRTQRQTAPGADTHPRRHRGSRMAPGPDHPERVE